MAATEGIKQHQSTWSPYDNNGGTCIAIAGSNYCVIAADTRMSTGYSILTRDYSKICNLSDKCVMASSGFQADVKALQKNLSARHLIYQHQHNKQMSCPAMAQLLSNTLYYKRFFPYYSFNVLGGLDNEGKGCVFTYDAVGSYERVGYSAQGTGGTLMMPVLDNQLKSPSPLLLPAQVEQDATTPVSVSGAVDLAKGMKHISSGPWGGEDGNKWDDGVYTGIRQIILFFGDVIESIIIEYDNNGSPFRLKHGESGGNKVEKIQLDYPKEILISISGHYDKYLRSLTFESNFKKYGPYGVENGTYFSSPLGIGKILGFYGRSDYSLHCIGVHLEEGTMDISMGPWGGKGGNIWDDGVYTGIRQIRLALGVFIDSINIEYDNNGSPFWVKHGGSGGNRVEKIQLDYPKEILTSISGHYDKYVRSLTFESNFKKYGPYGVENGIYFSSPLSKGKILGFYGRSGPYLDCIGVHLGEVEQDATTPVSVSGAVDLAKDATSPLSESEAVDLVKDVFASAAERDIYTGDGLEIVVVNAEGVTREFLELRRD